MTTPGVVPPFDEIEHRPFSPAPECGTNAGLPTARRERAGPRRDSSTIPQDFPSDALTSDRTGHHSLLSAHKFCGRPRYLKVKISVLKYIILAWAIVANQQVLADERKADECKPLIVTFHGLGPFGDMEEEMKRLARDIEEELRYEGTNGIRIEQLHVGWTDGDEKIAEEKIHMHKLQCPSHSIILIGHSYGGVAAFDVAFDESVDSISEFVRSLFIYSCKPLIVSFHGLDPFGAMEEAMIQLVRDIEEKLRYEGANGILIEKLHVGWMDGDEKIAEEKIHMHKLQCPSHSIILIGHSWGGDAAFDVAFDESADSMWESLTSFIYSEDKDETPDLLVTLDPVSWSAYKSRRFRYTKWVNVYVERTRWEYVKDNAKDMWEYVKDMDVKDMWEGVNKVGCELATFLGGYWGSEDMAKNESIEANHCDVNGFYFYPEVVHKEVVAIVSGKANTPTARRR